MALRDSARVFAALNVNVATVHRVTAAAEALRLSPNAAPARWIAAARLHVTVKFFGEVDLALIPALRDAMGAVAEAAKVPKLTLGGYSAFPSPSEARVVFVEVDDVGGGATTLAARLDDLAEELGLPRDSRPYRPHLSVARMSVPTDVRAWLAAAPALRVVAAAHELALYRSDLARPNAEYDALARFALSQKRPALVRA